MIVAKLSGVGSIMAMTTFEIMSVAVADDGTVTLRGERDVVALEAERLDEILASVPKRD